METAPNSGRWVYTATALRQAQDGAAVGTGTTVRPSTGLRAGPSIALRTGIAVTATDGSATLTTGRPGGVAEAEEEKAV